MVNKIGGKVWGVKHDLEDILIIGAEISRKIQNS